MEVPSSQIYDVAFQVFDRYRTVKAKCKGHPVQRGTGVWGNELDRGPLFLIEELHVAALELRRQGLGQKNSLVYGSVEAFERAWTLHALVSPGILTADIESQLMGNLIRRYLLLRACGFRQIEVSRWSAFLFDSQHQSRALAVASDFDPRRDNTNDLEDEELYEASPFTEVKKLKIERPRDSLPLHHAALTLADDELRVFFVTLADNKIGWDQVTSSEATPLHLTACELKPLSTQWLLENVASADSWKMAPDINMYTSLEALQENLEIMRTKKEVGSSVLDLSDHFRGYPDTVVSCLSLLSGCDALGLNDACHRYGYTCGDCVEGFLSARMRCSLIFHGETKYDFIQEDIDDGGFWIKDNDYILVHLESDSPWSISRQKEFLPQIISSGPVTIGASGHWIPKTTCDALGRRWVVGQCFGYLFDTAKEEDEKAGNGECQSSLKEEWSDLSTCRNDHEFEFVARACGYGGDDSISLRWW
ncbi:uncharacterized protein BDV17DRAFT_299411 [Aspergillus undulatus]|uniref:uncharacterized protein n=1 Tax=Aspergillus undulatus TaxID=1810928 RepID=UPI003CCDA4DE